MSQHDGTGGALEPYRVLDLAEGACLVCGRILADLGATVIKVEKPGGSPTRSIGPFYKGELDPNKSLFWFAYNAGKKSITLDIEARDGQEIFKRLVRNTDFVIESFSPGYLDTIGLGYESLSEVNPRVIVTSITPFGQSGPYAHYKASDLVLWSMGGFTYCLGEPGLQPVGPSVPLAFHNAGCAAASASLIAHWGREQTGEGQHVDVSAQQSVVYLIGVTVPYYDIMKFIQVRGGEYLIWPGGIGMRLTFPCKDGYIYTHIWGGADPGFISSNKALIAWMDEEDMASDWLKEFDWANDFSAEKITPEVAKRVHEPFARFFMTKTRKELYKRAVEHRIILAPVNTVKELLEDPQLEARGFWQSVEHPELSSSMLYPGYCVKMSETPARIQYRAPLIGEHNGEIYGEELGFSNEELALLRHLRVI